VQSCFHLPQILRVLALGREPRDPAKSIGSERLITLVLGSAKKAIDCEWIFPDLWNIFSLVTYPKREFFETSNNLQVTDLL
jgi:hypothetical protein